MFVVSNLFQIKTSMKAKAKGMIEELIFEPFGILFLELRHFELTNVRNVAKTA